MADVDEIIDYIKSLRRGFDKDLFDSKIDELAHAIDTVGLVYKDFHTLFKVWLNLSIPFQKWVKLGVCLVSSDIVEQRTVLYASRWILANFVNQQNGSRVNFLLGWLTAALECESIDMTALDEVSEMFYALLNSEALTGAALKLVYTLTKPQNITRMRALELIDYANKREGKKSLHRELLVLLGLYKSYKPECVPEDIPAISIHTAFKKLNEHVLERFRRVQEQRNTLSRPRQHLQWYNPINSARGGNKKPDPLVPNVVYCRQSNYDATKTEKTLLDFSDPVSLLQYSLQHVMARPTRLRSLLCNEIGQVQLAVMPHTLQVFLTYDLHHLLNNCFLELSPYNYNEKQDLLQRLAEFQRTLAQGIPVITRFLAQYLPFWNERDFFPQILVLVEWVAVDCGMLVLQIAGTLGKVYARAQPMEQCAILRSLTNMYINLVYSSTKRRYHFLNTQSSWASYNLVLPELAAMIADICHKGQQVDPDDMRVVYSSIWSARRRATSELSHGAAIGALPTSLALAAALLNPGPNLMDIIAELMILYKKIISTRKDKNEKHLRVLTKYTFDMLNCLYSEEALSGRGDGLIFEHLQPQLVDKLKYLLPDVDGLLSIRNHIAFAIKSYIPLSTEHPHLCKDYKRKVSNKELFYIIVEMMYISLGRFMKTALPELRYK